MTFELLAHTTDQFRAEARGWFADGEKGEGLAARLHREALRHGEFEPERAGAGPRSARVYRERATLQLPEPVGFASEKGPHGPIEKRLLRLADGAVIECVRLPMGRGRSTLCVSSQVGCARACTFCETGRMGLVRNLTTAEIVGQVVLAARERRPDALVFQGMGEPLDNLGALLAALAVLGERNGLGYAQERFTVCTVGHVPGIDALRELGWKRLNLALSLTTADEALRARLMPRSVRYSLGEIRAALVRFRQRRNLALCVHVCLLPGINDGPDEARAIAAFCAPLGRVLVHVIPYNPGTEPITRAPHDAEVDAFVAQLRTAGLAVRRRLSKGRSVMAGCGQLGAHAQRA